MTVLVDTHAHLDFPQFSDDLATVLDNAARAGVGPIINVGTSEKSAERVVALSRNNTCLWASVGIHPHYAARASSRYLDLLSALAVEPRVVAVGETGLDYFRNLSPPAVQEKVFREHIRLARRLNRPLIIHSREAHGDVLRVLQEESLPGKKGVIHCFSGGKQWVEKYLAEGFYISLAGPLTYPRSHELRESLKYIPPDRLLLETDSPYLSPQPYRSRRNEPAFIKVTYARAALILGRTIEQLAEQVYANACELFGLNN